MLIEELLNIFIRDHFYKILEFTDNIKKKPITNKNNSNRHCYDDVLDSHLTVKTRRRSISEANDEVNVVDSHFSKKTRRRNSTTKLPIVEATKRRGNISNLNKLIFIKSWT